MASLPRKKTSHSDFKLYVSLGSLIKDYRQWRALSQETFAESIGVSVRQLQNWEKNRYRARIDNLHDLSEYTGIPMQVCVALNADQPAWYSLRERRFVYSSIEIAQLIKLIGGDLSSFPQSDEGILIKNDRISTDKHINAILSCHHDIYETEKPLRRDVIKTATLILPELNRIIFDCWGHYAGHIICLPIKKDVYQQLKDEKVFESYLTTERMSDIVALQEGVFFFYSLFASSSSVVYSFIKNSVRYFAKIEPKKRYLVAAYSAVKEVKETMEDLGMRVVRIKGDNENKAGRVSTVLEVELNVLMTHAGPFTYLGWKIKDDDRETMAENLMRGPRQEGLPAVLTQETNNITHPYKNIIEKPYISFDPLRLDDPSTLDVSSTTDKHYSSIRKSIYGDEGNQNGQSMAETQQIYELKKIACPDRKCTLYGRTGEGNIVFNGSYRTKEGTFSRQFLCKKCNKSFCIRTGSIFYGLRSPEEKVLTALKLLVKGMPLRGAAKVLGVKLDTVRHWLKVAAQQSGKIDGMLMGQLKVSQAELDALWTSVRENSLRQRAIHWKKKNASHRTDLQS